MNPYFDFFSRSLSFRLLAFFGIGLTCACLWFEPFHEFWFVPIVGVISLLPIVIVLGRRRRMSMNDNLFGSIALSSMVLLGFGWYLIHFHNSISTFPKESRIWEGILLSSPQKKGKVAKCNIKIGNDKIWLTAYPKSTEGLSAGDSVWIKGRIEPLKIISSGDDYFSDWLRREGCRGSVYVGGNIKKLSPNEVLPIECNLSPWERLLVFCQKTRNRLEKEFEKLPLKNEEISVLKAMVLGNKSALSPSIRQLYADTGASHVLALSGLHLGILTSFLLVLLSPLAKRGWHSYLRIGLLLTFIWSFVVLTGASISLLRSAIMFSLLIICGGISGKGNSLNHLGIAAFILLLIEPMWITDVGFQLSFLSVFFILLLMPVWKKRFPVRGIKAMISDWFFISIAAQIGVAPLVIFYFHTFPVVFLLTNFIVLPCAYILLLGSILYLIAGLWDSLHIWVGWILAFILQTMHESLRLLEGLPFSNLEIECPWFGVLIYYMIIGILLNFIANRINLGSNFN